MNRRPHQQDSRLGKPSGSTKVLDERQCRELLAAATVGRFGFLHEGQVMIIPVNYRMDDTGDIFVRVSSSSVLDSLADQSMPVAFEVDYHHGTDGAGWSVLMSGSVRADPLAATALDHSERVLPWSGGVHDRRLRFTPERISGRRVLRRRN